MSETSYVDYYKEHEICPVFNDIDAKYLKQRESLYLQLGLIPAFLKDKTIIEFGPGNGINSLYTHSLNPSRYVLVDGNPKSLNNCQENFNKYFKHPKNISFIQSLFDDYQTEEKFDLTICEGFLPHQYNPKKCAKHLAQYSKVGGLFILTCHDHISTLPETLRSFIAYTSSSQYESFDEKLKHITSFLTPHLLELKSMSRTYNDWVLDNVMQVEHWTKTPLFSIPNVIETFEDHFIALNSSPRFITDFRWYKETANEKHLFLNQAALKAYWTTAHNFIDYRFEFIPRSELENKKLYQLCCETRLAVKNCFEKPTQENYRLFFELLEKLKSDLIGFSKETALSLTCYIENFKKLLNNNAVDFIHFPQWWGRGMQFLSLLRNK